MGYTNSPLVSYTKLSPNHSGQRNHAIDRITVHCVVGNCSVETLGEVFAPTSRQASSNYGIGVDGRVAMYVEEKNRSWCSSSSANDNRALTIECASDTFHPYAFKDVVYQKLITLCVDICKRNGKKKLLWLGSKEKALAYEPKSDEMVLTCHRWFSATSCPGDWMYAREGDLAAKVTAQLGSSSSASSSAATTTAKNTKFPATPFLVKVIIDDLNIRTKGSMSGKVVGQTGKGTFTITTVKNGWGKLKSGAGWIYLENPSYCTIGKTVSSGKESPQQSEKTESKEKVTGLQASSLKGLSEADVVKKMGPYFTADQKKSGILASVTAAQFILESGYGSTELAQKANNCFGMKRNLSGNTWSGSTWDGKSIYTKKTQEDDGKGNLYYITADFRKYPCVEDSIADHSAYLLGAMNGSKKRYAGLKGEKNYKKAIQIIKDGGYATDTKYVAKICEIIERWNLTQFDVKDTSDEQKQEDNTVKITNKTIIDITAANLSQVPASRGSNPIKFIVVHYLGVPNADNPYLYGGGYGGHYNIKRDGSIYKAADPRTAVVWHCGGGLQGSGGHTFHGICTNYNSIGIECGVCYTDTSVKDPSGDSDKWYFTTETQESLVWLVSKLMDEYGISADHVIRHYEVTGKICPNPYVKNNKLRTSWTWDEFKARLAEYRKSGGYSGTQEKKQEAGKEPVLAEKYAKYINSTATHYISNSGSDERGSIGGGQAGDQTGKEWQMRSWYSRPWSCVLRYPDQKVALKLAELGIDAALNDKIGYDQWQRDTYWQQLKNSGYEPSKITVACEADCSAGVCANVKATGYLLGIKALQTHGGTYTGDMRNALTRAGFQLLTDQKYLNSGDYLLPGDILLNDGHHTATNVTVGAKVKKSWNPGVTAVPITPTTTKYYRVRKSWEDKGSQIGAFTVLQNAVNAVEANPGYFAYDDNGNQIYPKPAFTPYLVRISISDLNYRKGPSASYESWGYIEPGIYTIVDEENGWGLLKAFSDKRDGWIKLSYTTKV